MNPRVAIAVLVASLVVAVVAWTSSSRAVPEVAPVAPLPTKPAPPVGETVPPLRIPHVPERLPTPGAPVPVEPVDEADHAPGRAFRSDRPKPNSTAGTIVPLPPATAEVWRQRRAAMAEAWEAESLEAAGAFAAETGMPAEDREAMLAILRAMHAELGDVRVEVESGSLRGPEARERTEAARAWARAALTERLGAETTEALAAAMQEEVRGGGF